jgi:hypothetical protein
MREVGERIGLSRSVASMLQIAAIQIVLPIACESWWRKALYALRMFEQHNKRE